MNQILNQQIRSFKIRVEEIVKNLHNLTININAEDLSQLVSDLRNRIHEPFMFVIVGEVKAGKSSFINALLKTGKEICKVAPQPMTDTIQQIIYGEEEEIIHINEHLKKIMIPEEILREIAIVDTPGTNSIVKYHQEITERFIPASDLIVFVFEAKNPYRQSAWEFFDYIHEDWRKKIIFVLQQKDLLSESDLEVNKQGVFDYALKKGISEPQVFTVSAKDELEDKLDISGFKEVRNYVADNITGGKSHVLKIENNISTASTIAAKINTGLMERRAQWDADLIFRDEISTTLDEQAVKSKNQVKILVENLIAGYERITHKKEQELASEISVFGLLKRSISSIFNKKSSIKNWSNEFAKNLERDLQNELQNKVQSSVGDLADSIQQMAKIINLKIQNSTTILSNDHEIFSDIADRRANVMADLQETFSKFINRSENFTDKDLFPETDSLSPNLLTGSGLAVVGTIIMTVTNGMVFDITGGILTAVGVVFAGFSTSVQRRKILSGFKAEVEKGRTQIEKEVHERLTTYVEHIKQRLDANFEKFDEMLKKEGEQIEALDAQFNEIESSLTSIEEELNQMLQ